MQKSCKKNTKKFKKILITGADGFIGSHLTEMLVRENFNVRAFVYYNSFNSWGWLNQIEPSIKKSLEVFMGDVRDPQGVRKAMAGCDAVIHLAALIGIPYSYSSPDSYVETNIKGTLNILQAARDLEVEKVVHTSTSEVYGTAKYVPIKEDHPLQAQSPYSASKIGADQIAISFYNSFGLPVSILRPFNTYGPRQSNRAVIPTIITQIISGKNEIKLGALHPTRDFNYVKDTIRAYISQLNTSRGIGQIINVGSNYEVSIKKTVEIIASLMQKKIKIVNENRRFRPPNSEVERLWASNEKAKKLLDWEPLYGGIEGFRRGLRETIDWFSEEKNLSLYKSDFYTI